MIYFPDDDVHQCGRCKEVFHDISTYMKHKTSKVCKNNINKAKVDASSQQQQQQQQQQTKQQNQQQSQQQLQTQDRPNETDGGQNILEAAAKNTIFRDSFISMADQQQVEGNSLDKETGSFTDDLWNDKDKDPNDMLMNHEDANNEGRKS